MGRLKLIYLSIWMSHKKWFYIGVLSMVSAYSLYPLLWKAAFYHLTAIGVVGIIRAYYLVSTGRHSLWVFIFWLWSVSNFIDEMYFNNSVIELNEYIAAVLIAVIVLFNPKKWIR